MTLKYGSSSEYIETTSQTKREEISEFISTTQDELSANQKDIITSSKIEGMSDGRVRLQIRSGEGPYSLGTHMHEAFVKHHTAITSRQFHTLLAQYYRQGFPQVGICTYEFSGDTIRLRIDFANNIINEFEGKIVGSNFVLTDIVGQQATTTKPTSGESHNSNPIYQKVKDAFNSPQTPKPKLQDREIELQNSLKEQQKARQLGNHNAGGK